MDSFVFAPRTICLELLNEDPEMLLVMNLQ